MCTAPVLERQACLSAAGVTLRENNLKEIEGGTIMQSQGILVASKKALLERPGLLQVQGVGGMCVLLEQSGLLGVWDMAG